MPNLKCESFATRCQQEQQHYFATIVTQHESNVITKVALAKFSLEI